MGAGRTQEGVAGNCLRISNVRLRKGNQNVEQLSTLDRVATNANSSQCKAHLYIFKNDEAVIKMIIKGRSPMMRHVSRSHRVALDWLFDRINLDPKIHFKYFDTKKPARWLVDWLKFDMESKFRVPLHLKITHCVGGHIQRPKSLRGWVTIQRSKNPGKAHLRLHAEHGSRATVYSIGNVRWLHSDSWTEMERHHCQEIQSQIHTGISNLASYRQIDSTWMPRQRDCGSSILPVVNQFVVCWMCCWLHRLVIRSQGCLISSHRSRNRASEHLNQHLETKLKFRWSHPEPQIATWVICDRENQKHFLKTLLKNARKTKIKSIPKVKGQKPAFHFIQKFWEDLSANEFSYGYNWEPKPRNVSVNWYDMSIREKERQMEHFIGH